MDDKRNLAETSVAFVEAPESRLSSERWAIMSRLDRRIHQSFDLDEILRAAVDELGTYLGLDRCLLLMIDPAVGNAAPACQYTAPGIDPMSVCFRTSELAGVDHFIFGHGELVVTDVLADPMIDSIYERYLMALGTRSLICVPVDIDGVPRAILCMVTVTSVREWDQEDVALGRAVADRLGVAIKQAELFQQVRAAAREAEALYRASSMLIDTTDLDRLYEQILDAIADVFGHPDSSIWLVDEATREAVLGYTRGDLPAEMPRRLPLAGNGLIAYSVRNGKIVNCPDVSADERYLQGPPRTRSELIVPLKVDGTIVAVFNVESHTERAFTEHDERILNSFAERAARVVEQARLYNQAQEAAAREALISRITSLLNQSLDAQSIFQELVEELGSHLNVDRCFMIQVDSKKNSIKVTHQYSTRIESVPDGFDLRDYQPIHDHVTFGPVALNDVMTDGRIAGIKQQFEPYKIHGFLAVPVSDRGQFRFVIICTTYQPRQWTHEEIDLVRALAAQAAIARERAELFHEVRRSQLEWERTFDAMPEAVFVINEDRILSRANLAAAALQGFREARPVGQRCCEIIRRSLGLTECLIEQAIETRQPIVREITPPHLGQSLLFSIEPVFSPTGESHGAVAIARDLTDIKQAEAEAEKQKQFLSRLLEIAHDAVFVLDRDGKISWSNLRLADLSGYRPEELREMRLPDLITTAAGQDEQSGASGETSHLPETFEAQLTCRDGARRWVLATSTPIYEDGRLSGILGILHDITDVQIATEKVAQAEKLRALGQLAGGVAHNFNNLLAAILGHTQLLKRKLAFQPEVDRLEIIERAAMDGAAMVRRINSFSLQESDEKFEPIDLNQVVRDSLEITRTRWEDDARARGINYTIDFRPSGIPPISGRASELREVFVNIIFNALDAMVSHGGRLQVTTGFSGTEAFTRFTDEGLGMSAEVRERIFEPFFTTKGVSGIGLGLSASYAIVERHSGRIDVESDTGRGSAFTVWLPLARLAGAQISAAGTKHLNPVNILVVDDDIPVRDALAEILEAHGHSVTRAASASEALTALQTNPGGYSVIFVDLAMPDMDGLALARAVRSLEEHVHRGVATRILLITGYGDASLMTKQGQGLIEAVVAKPFREADILGALDSALSLQK